MKENNFLPIGKIVGVHGVKGVLKVSSYAESITVFQRQEPIRLINSHGFEGYYNIKGARENNRGVFLNLEGITSRTQAENFVGSDLFIEKEHLPVLEDGSYYWSDLIGMAVYSIDEEFLGHIKTIFQTGSNDVYVIQNKEMEILVPALESVVSKIDIGNQIMIVELPEGL